MLEVAGIETFHGRAQALFGVSLTVAAGEIVALLGRNGMGKTTTIRTLCRMQTPYRGTVWFDGRDITALPSFKAARLGIGLVPEGRRCFATLTVTENLIAAARPGPWTLDTVRAFFPRLGEREHQQASTLSGGEQQMLAIGRALMTNPRLLVLDEATEGLAPVIRKEIWTAIARLKGQGQSILIVDKTLSELKPIADTCVILERGRSVWSGRPSEITPEIERKFLGL